LFRIHGRKRSGILPGLIVTTFFARMTFVVPCAKKIQLHSEDLAGLLGIETADASFRIDRLREYLAKNY
jgi:hypothetical protein